MGTLAEGIKEIFGTTKQSGTNVMLCGNDGTPDGHMTMANLASVLGGLQYKGNARDNDLNNLETGLYTLEGAENIISGSTIYGTLIVVKGAPTSLNHMGVFQIVYDINGKGVFYREQWVVGTWNTWKKITTGIPDFYKDYANISSLANALGGLYQISVINNSCDVNSLGSGIYGVNAQLTNAPAKTGASMLIIMEVGWIRCDVILDREAAKLFYRFKWGSAGFEEWKLIS